MKIRGGNKNNPIKGIMYMLWLESLHYKFNLVAINVVRRSYSNCWIYPTEIISIDASSLEVSNPILKYLLKTGKLAMQTCFAENRKTG